MIEATTLEQRLSGDGQSWAREVAAQLRLSGRPVAGGWPGTLSEARARVWPHVEGSGQEARAPEFERLVQLTYAAARRTWLTLAHDDENED